MLNWDTLGFKGTTLEGMGGYFRPPHPGRTKLIPLLGREQIRYQMRSNNPAATLIPSAEMLRFGVCRGGGGIFYVFLVSGASLFLCARASLCVFSFPFLPYLQEGICSQGNYDRTR